MLNKVCIMGRLVRDPELRRTQSGIAVTTMRIAVDRDFKNPDGTKQADFFDVVAWRNTAEFVSRYFSKGRMMVVEGRLQTRDWTDREGNKRINTEIVADNIYFGESRRDASNGEYGGYGSAPGYGNSGGYGSGNSGGYGSGNSGGYGSGNSGGYGSGSSGGYGSGSSGGYGSGNSGGYGSGNSGGYGYGGYSGGYGSGGYGSGYGSGNSGGYSSGASGYGSGFGGFDNNAASNAAPDAPGADNSASADNSAPSKDAAPASAPSSFAEVADDDGDLPF